MKKVDTLIQWILESKHIVFFGGAGVSTESGLKDFRSQNGLYHEKYDYPPEEILSHTFFVEHTEEFFKFYKDKLNVDGISPNITHEVLVMMEKKGMLSSVITQNIDGLHQLAGSHNVLELHGSIHRNYCMECGKSYDSHFVFSSKGIPRCQCGGIIKPDVVLYEEGLDDETVNNSIKAIRDADLLIVAGTSLTVYPASGLINYFRGRNLVLINRDATLFDNRADLVINESLGNVMSNWGRF